MAIDSEFLILNARAARVEEMVRRAAAMADREPGDCQRALEYLREQYSRLNPSHSNMFCWCGETHG